MSMTESAAPHEAWTRWLQEAHELVVAWEQASDGPLLSSAAAARLSERIARALEIAFERGRRLGTSAGSP